MYFTINNVKWTIKWKTTSHQSSLIVSVAHVNELYFICSGDKGSIPVVVDFEIKNMTGNTLIFYRSSWNKNMRGNTVVFLSKKTGNTVVFYQPSWKKT